MSSWLSPLYRVLAFSFLAWRIGVNLLGKGDLIGLGGEVNVWQMIRLFLDFGFLVHVVGRWETPWVLPLTGGWVAVSLLAQEGKWCSSLTTVWQALPYLGLALLLSFLLVQVFNFVGMRGRILLVCLLTSSIPLGFLTVAMFRQTDQLVDEYLRPIGESWIAKEALRLDRNLARQVSTALRLLLELTPHTRLVAPQDPDALRRKGLAAGIPIRAAFTAPMDSGLSLDFENVTLKLVASIVAKERGLAFLDLSTRASSVPISLKVNGIELDDLVERLNLNRLVTLRLEGRSLILEDRQVAASPCQPLAITYQQATARLGSHGASVGRLRFPRPGNGQEMKVDLAAPEGSDPLRLVIDLEAWLHHLIPRTGPGGDGSTPFFPIAILPGDGSGLSHLFSGFVLTSGEPTQPVSWGISGPAIDAGPPEILLQPQDISYSGLRAVREPVLLKRFSYFSQEILSPTGEQWLIEAWLLPSVRTPVILALPARAIARKFRPQQDKSLLLGILMVFVAAHMSILYSERLSRPIQAITDAARRIKEGDLETRIPVEPDQAEIRELGETLALMAERLTGRIEVANRRLAEEKVRFETLVESTWEGIFLIDGEGAIVYANHSGRQLLGAIPDAAAFCTAFRGLGTDFQVPLPARLDPALTEFKTVFTVPMKQAGGTRIFSLYLRSCHSPTQVNGTSSPGFIAVCRDITIEKEIDRMKTDFVSQVSHELRTPLTSIQAYTEMLLDGEVDSPTEQRDYLRIIFDESERLTRLINDLLDIARIESGRRVIKPVVLDLVAVARNVTTVLAGMAETRKITVGVQVPDGPVRIHADPDLIKQVGLNLLSNAIKYTPEGGRADITVSVEADGRVVWAFRDTGIGLTPKDRDRLFTKFFRADSEAVRAAGGTGLGLVLVKQIVEAHQAEITVASSYGNGSTFTVRFRPLTTS